MDYTTTKPSLQLHHVGYLVKDIEAASAHYCGLLGYHVESAVIEDPIQMAKVQFLRQAGSASWLELISPANEHSHLANALQKGVLLHHLCYEVADMDDACRYLRGQKCFPVGQPVAATAFPGRRIAWFMDTKRFLFELLEAGQGELSLHSLRQGNQ